MSASPAETTSHVPPPPSAWAPSSSITETVKGSHARPRRSVVLIAVATLLVLLILGLAARAFFLARGRAGELVVHLHTRMNQNDWSGIYGDADSVYQAQTSSSDSEALFAAINRKLGKVNRTSQVTTNVTINSSGSFLTAQFETQFAGDEHARETIVWRSLGGDYHLHSYNIQSLPLLTK